MEITWGSSFSPHLLALSPVEALLRGSAEAFSHSIFSMAGKEQSALAAFLAPALTRCSHCSTQGEPNAQGLALPACCNTSDVATSSQKPEETSVAVLI